MTKALALRRQPLKSLEPVDKESTNAAAPHRLHQPIAGFVEQPLGRWLPDNLNMTLVDQPLDWQLQRLGLVQDRRGSLVEPEVNAGSLSIALAEEMQADCGLADPRRTDQERGRVMRETPAHNAVELSDARRHRRPGGPIHDRGVGQQCFGARVYNNPVVSNAV